MYISCNVIESEKPVLEFNTFTSMWYDFDYESACMFCLDCDDDLYFPMSYDDYLKFHKAVLTALKNGDAVFEVSEGIALSIDSEDDDFDDEFESAKELAKNVDYFSCFDYEY